MPETSQMSATFRVPVISHVSEMDIMAIGLDSSDFRVQAISRSQQTSLGSAVVSAVHVHGVTRLTWLRDSMRWNIMY